MFLQYAFIQNKWLWFHILAGGILAKIFLNWVDSYSTVILIGVVALAWEVREFVTKDVEEIYESKKRFFMDAAGDIIGAVVMALIVIV